MANIVKWLLPKEKRIFEMLSSQSKIAVECANELKDFIADYESIERKDRKLECSKIKEKEEDGDRFLHDIMLHIYEKSSSIPDKDELKEIAKGIEDIIDSMNAIASKLVIYGVERIDKNLPRTVGLLVQIVSEISSAIDDIRHLRNFEKHLANTTRLEKQADDFHEESIAELFHYYKASHDLIKYKELYDILENAINKCKGITGTIENIKIKNS